MPPRASFDDRTAAEHLGDAERYEAWAAKFAARPDLSARFNELAAGARYLAKKLEGGGS